MCFITSPYNKNLKVLELRKSKAKWYPILTSTFYLDCTEANLTPVLSFFFFEALFLCRMQFGIVLLK